MVAVPTPVPNTTPLTSTIAIAGLLVLQVPPVLPLVVRLTVEFLQTVEAPDIVPAFAAGLTFTL